MAAYKGSIRRIEKLSNIVLVFVTIVLSSFLIGLGNKILADFTRWIHAPQWENFQNKSVKEAIEQKEKILKNEGESLYRTKRIANKELEVAKRQYSSERKSFDNWLRTRRVIGSAEEDPLVRSRGRKLDKLRLNEEEKHKKADKIEMSFIHFQEKQTKLHKEKDEIYRQGQKKYKKALQAYQIKIFFIRLLFVGPILGLGIFIFIRHRKNRYWPLVWGFLLFSVYTFFIGLLPYLPHFGGYIRSLVGISLTVFIGYHVVKQLTQYIEKKKAELQESSAERVKKIKEDAALKAFQSHCCPSCEKDFLLNKWYPKVRQVSEVRSLDEAPNHCNHCGLPLFGKCVGCGTRNFLHFFFCSSCGKSLKESVQ